MKNKLLTVAGALALLTVAGKFYAVPLMAQVRAALVSDVDNPARNPVRLSINVMQPTGFGLGRPTICFETGYTVPAGRRLVIDDVSVSTNQPSATISGMFTQLTVTLTGATTRPCDILTNLQRRTIAVLPFTNTVFGSLVFGGPLLQFSVAHERTQIYVEPGEVLSGNVVNTGGLGSEVTYNAYIFGHLVTLP